MLQYQPYTSIHPFSRRWPPRCCYHSDPLDEALHLRPCNTLLLAPITFSNPYPFSNADSGSTPAPFMTPTPPGHHNIPEHSTTLATKRPPSSKPHRFFLQRWLPESCHMTCFFAFNSMISFLGTNVIIPDAVLQETQPYSCECSCLQSIQSDILVLDCPVTKVDVPFAFTSLLHELSSLSTIIEGEKSELNKTEPFIPSDFSFPSVSNPPVPWRLLLPYPPSALIPISTSFYTTLHALFTAPQIVLSLRPPPKPPHLFLSQWHLQKRVLATAG